LLTKFKFSGEKNTFLGIKKLKKIISSGDVKIGSGGGEAKNIYSEK
jgi:hypothetical protein